MTNFMNAGMLSRVTAVLTLGLLAACGSSTSSTGLGSTTSSTTSSTSGTSTTSASSTSSTSSGSGTTLADPIALSAASYSVAQNAGTVTISVARTGSAAAAVSVNYATTDGTAVAGTDYTSTTGTLNWAENDSTTKTFSVPISDKTPFTGSRAFAVALTDPSSGGNIAAPGSATVAISGADSTSSGELELSQSSFSISEAAKSMQVTVNRVGGSSGQVTVHYATSNDTATAGKDYTAASGTLTWEDGDASSKTFGIALSDAVAYSGTKTFNITLSDPGTGAALGTPSSATVNVNGTVTSGAGGSMALTAASYSVAQSGGNVTMTVARTGGTTGAVSVEYATTNGTAEAGTDFTAETGTLSWASGDNGSKTFTVPVSNADPFTGNKTFTVALTNPSGGGTVGSPGAATVTIAGDASAAVGSLEFSGASYSVAQGAGSLTVTVNRVGGSTGAVGLSYGTSNGTAVAGTDFTASSGKLAWASGDDTAKTFTVPVSDATPFSGTRSFTIALSAPTGGTSLGSPATATVAITGGASTAVGSLQLSAATYAVNETAGSLSFTINRTGGSSGAVAVNYATANGSATAGTNYTATSGTLSWASGNAASQTVKVPVSTSAFSGTKTFNIALSGATDGATLSTPSSATVTITGSGAVGTAVTTVTSVVGGGGTTGTSSGSLPVAPTVTSVFSKPEGATIFFTNQEAANGNYVQHYTATSNPGGITATSNGNSNRIDIEGLTGGVNYTFTVTATNAAGTGPASAASASVTAGDYADYWVANGSGLSSAWSTYAGTEGNSINWNATPPSGVTPPTGNTVVAFSSNGSNPFILPFVEHNLIDSNGNQAGVNYGGGKLFLGPYTYFVISIYATHANQKVGFQFYQTNAINGMLTQQNGSSTSTFEDTTQNFVSNFLSGNQFTYLDLTNVGGNYVTSNTSSMITTSGVPREESKGDYYELSEPDQLVSGFIEVGNGNGAYGPATMTVGQWNTYKIPLSAFGNSAWPYGNQILKFMIQDVTGASSTFYISQLGFTNH